MPQLEVSTFAPQLVWLAITFCLLYVLMARIGLPRVGSAIDARRHRIDDDLARASQLKSEAETVMAAYQQTLASARAEAQAAGAAEAAYRRSIVASRDRRKGSASSR